MCIRDSDKIVDATIEAAAEGAKYGFSIPSPDIGMRIALACDIVRKAKDDQQALHDLYAMFGGGDLSADSIPSNFSWLNFPFAQTSRAIMVSRRGGNDA